MTLRRYTLRTLGQGLLVLALVSVLTSLLLELAPGDPAYAILGDDATPEAVARVHEDLDLDKPWIQRYASWIVNAVQGDLGTSYRFGAEDVQDERSVTGAILEALPVTAQLMASAILGALLLAIPAATYAAHDAGGRFDKALTTFSSFLTAIPSFVLLPLFVYVFVVTLEWFPVTGWVGLTDNPFENLHHAFLPTVGLALGLFPPFVTALRQELGRTMNEDFILNARAKGIHPRGILLRHALRPSSFLLLTLSGALLGALIGSTVITEHLFAFHGLGGLVQGAVQARDTNLVQGITLFVAAIYVVVNASIDVVYGYIDPRVRVQAA